MHLYRYFELPGNMALYLKKLCIENADFNNNSHYFCKDFVRSSVGSHPTLELKVSHPVDEIQFGVPGVVRFAVKFLYLKSMKDSRYPVQGISRMIFVAEDKIKEVGAFDDIDDFQTYYNYSGNMFVESSEEEKEECIR